MAAFSVLSVVKEDPDRKVAEVTQASFPGRRQTLTLYPDRIELSVRTPLDRYRTPYYLHSIKEEPDRIFVVPWRALALGAIVLAAAAAMAWGPAFLRHRGGAIVGASLGCLWLLAQLARVRGIIVYFYRTVSGRWRGRLEPQLWLWPDRPSASEVERFMEIVAATQRRHLAKVREESEEGPVPYVRELDRFAQLHELKVVTEEEFARIKAKLLNIKPRRIGF